MTRLIDADALPKYDGTALSAVAVAKAVEDAPTVDPVRHGRWIKESKTSKGGIFACSVCGRWAYSPWVGSRKSPKPNVCRYEYCPHCGAKMDEVEE